MPHGLAGGLPKPPPPGRQDGAGQPWQRADVRLPETTAPMKRRITVLLLVALAGLGLRAFTDPVPADRLQRLRKGMTKAEVQAALGAPSKKYGSGQWTYQRPLVFGFVNIHWQADGTYDGYYNYERY